MAKGKFTPGSLDAMVSNVRGKKMSNADAAKTSLARSSREQQKSKELVDSSSSSESSENSGSESESDVDVEAERQKWAAKVASKNKPAESKVNGTKSTPAKPTPDTTKKATKKQVTSDSESTSDSDSDSDSDSSSAGPNKTSSSNPVAKQKAANKSESESESDSDSEEESDKEDAAQSAEADASPSEDTSSDDSSSSDNEAEDDAANGVASKSKNGKEKDSASGSNAIARANGDVAAAESDSQVARPPWLNSSDFMLRKASSDNPGKEVADFFSNANLEGKQLWYFTAPASLPITVLKDMEIDLAKVTSGGPLLKHEGDDYGLDLEPFATNTQIQLLIPSHGGDKYTSLNRGIDSTVHLRRMAKFGPGGEVGATASSEYAPQPKPIRQQPQGLKVRFTPIGVPSPQVPKATQDQSGSRKASTPRRSAISKPSPESDSESSPTSDSESDSDVEMTNVSEVPLPTTGAAKGALKRKHTTEEQASSSVAKETKSEGKATKKPKSTPSQLLSGKKETPVQPPSLPHLAPASTSTPSKQSTSKSKDKKDKKDKATKTPKGAEKAAKSPLRTPVPPPAYVGMTR